MTLRPFTQIRIFFKNKKIIVRARRLMVRLAGSALVIFFARSDLIRLIAQPLSRTQKQSAVQLQEDGDMFTCPRTAILIAAKNPWSSPPRIPIPVCGCKPATVFGGADLPILSQLSRSVDPPEKEAMSILHPSFERYTQLQEQHTPAEASHMVSSV